MHTSYFSLERRKTLEFNELLAEQRKQRIYHKLKILEKSFELQKEQLLGEAFEAKRQVQLANLEQKAIPEVTVVITVLHPQWNPYPQLYQGPICYLTKPKN